MKKLVIIFLILLSVKAFAQNAADSSYLYQQNADNLMLSQQNSTFLIASPIVRIGIAQFYYRNISGGFRPVQQAQKNVNAGVYSGGIHKFNRFSTTGYFSFNRTWQDSLAWSTKGLEQDDQPYYYGSIKPGAFERQNYKLGGIMNYNLIKDKLYIGSGVTYEYNVATRSVDPRPQVNSFKLILNPEIVYSFHQQYFGLTAKWGYGTERTSIGFKNGDFKNSTTGYPDRVNYLIMGYGLITNNQGVSNPLKRLDKYFGFGANYSGTFGNYNFKSSISYNNIKEDNYQDFDESVNRAYLSYYDTDLVSMFFQIDKKGNRSTQQLSVGYSNQNSNDINIIFYAINYRYLQDLVDFKYLLKFNNQKKFSPEIGLTSSYKKVEKTDYATAHFIDYARLETVLLGNTYFELNKAEELAIGLGVGYRKPLSSHISIPETQQKLFTQAVVFPDYTYNTSSAIKLTGKINYINGKIFKQFKTGISANFSYYNKLESKYLFPTADKQLGSRLFDGSLALNLYF